MSEPILDVSWLVKAEGHQFLDALLSGRPAQRIEKDSPFRRNLGICRQTSDIHETLHFCDRLLVEGRNSFGKPIYEIIQFRIR